MAKKPVVKKSGKRRFAAGSLAALERALPFTSTGSSGDLIARGGTDLESPKGRDLMRRGSKAVGRPGRPTIDVDLRGRNLPGSKSAGSGQSDAAAGRNAKLSNPKLDLPSAKEMSGRGNRGSNIGRIAAGAIGAGAGLATQKGIQSLATGPNAGMDTTGTIAALNRSDKGNQRVVMQGDLPVGVVPKRDRAAFPQGSPESSIPAPKKAAPKPVARKPRGPSADDAFMEDLRASAARMKADTAEAARATGRMKGAMEEFQSATDDATEGYKRGGRVGGRGDGKAVRGRTKGRFI